MLRTLKSELENSLERHAAGACGDQDLMSAIKAFKSKHPDEYGRFRERFNRCWDRQRKSWTQHMNSKHKIKSHEELEASHERLFEDEFDMLERSKAALVGYELAIEKIKTKGSVQGCSFVHKELVEYVLRLKSS